MVHLAIGSSRIYALLALVIPCETSVMSYGISGLLWITTRQPRDYKIRLWLFQISTANDWSNRSGTRIIDGPELAIQAFLLVVVVLIGTVRRIFLFLFDPLEKGRIQPSRVRQ